jgi:diguanylate cyclase (GGDEF)-like protein
MTRDIPDTGTAAGDSALVVAEERNRLSQALLEATAALARGRKPDDILRMVCDALSASTSHIRLAWMVLGDLDAEVLCPQYASGPARRYTQSLAIERGTPAAEAPSRRAVSQWEPQTAVIAGDPSFDKMRRQAQQWSLESVLTLPLGRRDSPRAGLVSIYADRPDYFAVIGQDLFSAFAHVVNASLEQSELMQTLSHLANHDQLTNLLNRRGIEELLERELARSRRHQEPFSIALFDVDRFKLINDSLGHRRGDAVLRRLAASAQHLLRQEDVLARWGGEEFLCLLPETGRDHAWAVAERMRHAIEESPLEIPGGNQNVTVSFGVATCPDDGPDLDKLIAAADAALYQAKTSGRNRTAAANTLAQPLYSVGSMLDTALRQGRIVPAYQPIVELASGKTVAEEALARILTPDGTLIEAGQFIEAASQLQLLHRIDQTIMLQGFEHCVAGLKTGANALNHFVNVSADLLRHRDLVRTLLDSARAHCAGCDELTGPVKPMIIEITERELVRDIATARELLQPFIDFGLRLALDDFGSGYSSYQYLADLPVSFLKIDGQLVRRLNEPKVRAIVQGIQDTAQQLGLTTLAECVENREIEAVLQDIGVHWGQGYHYGKPRLAGDTGHT